MSLLLKTFLASILSISLSFGGISYQNVYNKARAYTNNPYYVVVDLTKPSTEKRFYIYDSRTGSVIYSTYVAHGAGSGRGVYVTSVSNQENSGSTSVGVYYTREYYNGKHGRVLRVQGIEKGFNDNAYNRLIEVHGAKYIGNGLSGHSLGCFAVPMDQMPYILNILRPNTLIIAYYPDSNWLHNSKFL